MERLALYSESGADCLYAPGVRTAEQISAGLAVAWGKPVNVLTVDPANMSMGWLAGLGVRWIPVGLALARLALAALMRAARSAVVGDFTPLANAAPFATFSQLFEVPMESVIQGPHE